jgi:hypothetical protein
MSKKMQLTSASEYDVKNMIFAKPEVNTIPGGAIPISYKRISIGTVYDDGSTGDLILSTERLFSFGIQKQAALEAGKPDTFIMPLCLWTKDAATREEKQWTDLFEKIVDRCKEHLVEVRDDIGKYELEKSDLKKLNPLYWKRGERGKIIEGVGPTLYIKLLQRNPKKLENGEMSEGKVITNFYDEDTDEPIDPLSLVGKYCYVRGAVKIESIFIGNQISLQIKLYEAYVHVVEMGTRRLLSRPAADQRVTHSTSATPVSEDSKAPAVSYSSTNTSKLVNSDDEDDDVPPKRSPPATAAPTTTRKVVPKKK